MKTDLNCHNKISDGYMHIDELTIMAKRCE